MTFVRLFPWIAAGLAALYLLVLLVPPGAADGAMRLYEFGQLPVQSGGRVKPIDSVARTTMLVVSSRQTWRVKGGAPRPAVEWLLDVMTGELAKDSAVQEHEVFRIENDQLLELLNLKAKPGSFRYSIDEMRPRFAELDDKAQRALEKEATDHDLLERKVLELRRHLEMYLELSRWHEPRMIPPKSGAHWQPFGLAVLHERSTGEGSPALRYLKELLLAYAQKDAKKFNAALDEYHAYLSRERPDDLSSASLEADFNNFEPFYQCSLLYLVAFVMTCLGWLVFREPLRKAAFWLIVLTLAVHTGALLARMYIGGRPPVTNLYSSAVFIGWAAVILGIIIELIYGLGIGNFVATVTGSATVLIAHFLGSSGDTLDVMQAVLDTNFWLATHVVCITLGYAATYVAGILGMTYLGLGVFTRLLTRDLSKTIGQAMYGVVCFAMFLSFTGTVLGGIWADQSWGRFWGWDPKENGALLIVLINALVLHARWGGLVKERGIAILSVVGNIVVTWSWFGVNMLGVGLHSYGFMEGAVKALLAADGVFLAFIVAGLVPQRFWLSASAVPPVRAKARLKPG